MDKNSVRLLSKLQPEKATDKLNDRHYEKGKNKRNAGNYGTCNPSYEYYGTCNQNDKNYGTYNYNAINYSLKVRI